MDPAALTVEDRLRQAGIALPEPSPLLFDYEPVRLDGGIAYLAGQIPKTSQTDMLHTGAVGSAVSLEGGQEAAGRCVLNGLAWLKQVLGGLDRIELPLTLRGYVVADDDAVVLSRVVDGATDMLVQAFGPRGRCPRTVIGVSRLPFDAPVLIELVFRLQGAPGGPGSP